MSLDMKKGVNSQEISIPGLGTVSLIQNFRQNIQHGEPLSLEIFLPGGIVPVVRESLYTHNDVKVPKKTVKHITKF